MEKSVIPRMFGELIEQYHAKRNPGLLPPEESTIGSKNKKTAPGEKQKRKPRKGGKKTPSAKENAIKEEKPEKDVYFSFGEILQLAYRRQPLASTRERTLFYKEDGTEIVAQSVEIEPIGQRPLCNNYVKVADFSSKPRHQRAALPHLPR